MQALDYKNSEIKTRGVNLRNLLDAMRYKKGTDGVAEMHLHLSKKYGITLTHVIEKEWYPLWYEFAFLEVLCTMLHGEPQKNAEVVGERGAEDIGILKFFVKFAMSPNALATRAENDWKNFYNGGKFVIHKNVPGEIICEICDFPYFELYAHNIKGFLKGVLKLAGARNPRVEIIGNYKYRCTWEK
ncbi:MAG: hypothetical protein QXJ27_00170 [Thermoplasmata archaeon]